MNRFQRLLLVGSLAAIVFSSGCNQQNGQASHEGRPPAVDAAAIARADARISQPAWLRERLPEQTVAYLRIPSLWGSVSAPDGRPLDTALAAEQHVKIIAALRKAAQSDPLLAQAGAGSVMQILFGDQATSIEVAVIDPSGGVSPFSRALVTTVLDVADVAALNARITALNANAPSPLRAPIDANGDAALQQFGALHFDAQTHRLYLSVGTTASSMTLEQDLAQLKTTRTHPMQDAEREIDTSGQGLFFWMSMKGLNTQLEAQLQNEPPDGLFHDALNHTQSVAIGWGTVEGRGKLQLQVRVPQARLLGYLAPNAGDIGLKTSGNPDWAMTVALPGSDNLQAIHDHLDHDFGEGLRANYDAVIAKIQSKIGTDPIAFDRPFGAHAVIFADANGRFLAVQVRDRAGLYAKFDDLSHRLGGKNEVVKAGDTPIHHLYLPGFDIAANQPGMDPQAQAWARLYSRIGSHYYWIEEGDYLVFASVPQGLVDRVASKPDTSLSAWLHGRSYDSAHTLIGVASTTHNMQREMYYVYLQGLQLMGDALAQPIDLASMPSAGELRLPVEGASGIALEANGQRIALNLTYEQSPVEGLFSGEGGATGAVFVTAILAAIALPAYQDYTIRSQVSEGAVLADSAKFAIAEYYSKNGGMPNDNVQAGIAAPERISGNFVSSVTIADGKIIVAYDGPKSEQAIKGSVLVFSPVPGNGQIKWTCDTAAGTTVNMKYRPQQCRP